MTTVVNTPNSDSGGAGGWIVAGIVIVVVALVAIFVWPGFGRGSAAPAAPAALEAPAVPTEINVQLPTPDVGGAPAE
jgi:hypothetical protein